ncbi:50S ribosomal protein L13 [Candidatus Saccharibacteria bacterium]|mgnify:FL=1|nr:MAG: 50S ribosomal protein L13 [Candidatus Saccharibacteria bacterium]
MADFKTYQKKAGEVEHKWIVVDVANVPVGRAATFIATRLTGKYDPSFTPHMDSGDYVVVINADAAKLTGDKTDVKAYYHYTGFPGGIKEKIARDVPMTSIIERAVRGMLPKNKLQADRMARLRVFAGADHDHAAQQPQKMEVK